MTEVINISD